MSSQAAGLLLQVAPLPSQPAKPAPARDSTRSPCNYPVFRKPAWFLAPGRRSTARHAMHAAHARATSYSRCAPGRQTSSRHVFSPYFRLACPPTYSSLTLPQQQPAYSSSSIPGYHLTTNSTKRHALYPHSRTITAHACTPLPRTSSHTIQLQPVPIAPHHTVVCLGYKRASGRQRGLAYGWQQGIGNKKKKERRGLAES